MSIKKAGIKLTEIYLLLLVSVHLLYLGFSGYSHIFDAKILTFCTINILYFVCLLIALFLFWDRDKKLIYYLRQRLTKAHICVFLYMLFTVISGCVSARFPETVFGVSRFEGMFTICLYCFTFFALSLFPVKSKYVLITFSVSASIFGVLCILQLAGFNTLGLYPAGTNFYDAGVRYTTAFIGTIGNTNLSGAFICLALPFLKVLMLKLESKKRFLLLIPICLLAVTALKMGVTSTILGLLAGAILTLPIFLKLGKKGTMFYFIALLIIAFSILAIIYFYPAESGFIHEVSEILHGNISDSFGSGRIRIWRNVLSEIPDSPIIGKGPDTMMREDFAPFERYYPALGKIKKTGIDVAHNEFLNVLYHQGILGLLAYIGFIFFTLKAWFKNRHDTVVLALGVGVICYLVQSLFTFSMCLTAPYFWIAAGLIIGISRDNMNEPTLD